MRDQIAFYAFHSFLMEVLRMCNSKLEIRIKSNPLSLMPATIKLKLLEKSYYFTVVLRGKRILSGSIACPVLINVICNQSNNGPHNKGTNPAS